MSRLESIFRGVTKVLELGMKGTGLASAFNQLLLHPNHVESLQLFLSGVLLLGGQATKDLLLGLLDRLVTPEHRAPGRLEEPPADGFERERRR